MNNTQNTQSSKTTREDVAKKFATKDPITMYRLANIMSDVLGKHVREQMLYNYRAKGLIKTNSQGRCEVEVAIDFIMKRVAKLES